MVIGGYELSESGFEVFRRVLKKLWGVFKVQYRYNIVSSFEKKKRI